MKILHIAPHYGGGTKTVILNWIKNDKQNIHTLVSLGYADEEVAKACDDNDILLFFNYEDRNYSTILNLIPMYDIVLIHYWNFPLMLDFIINNKLPECRIITWFHNSGFHAPYELPESLIEYCDRFVFTSPISYELPVVKNLSNKLIERLRCIWSTGGTERYNHIKKKKHNGFNLLYIGTLDYAKLDKDFVSICQIILQEIPDSKITICGSGCDMENISKELYPEIKDSRVIMTGYTFDLTSYLEEADIFLYPLSNKSFATCEQVLGETGFCGIPAVVFNNRAETEIVKHLRNGLVANTTKQYIEYIKVLKENLELRQGLSNYACMDMKEKYSLTTMIYEWDNLFKEVTNQVEKKEREWKSDFIYIYGIGMVNFIESLDNETAKVFHEYISTIRRLKNLFSSNLQWQSESKGSIKQYLKYFPEDKWLQEFKKIMDEEI